MPPQVAERGAVYHGKKLFKKKGEAGGGGPRKKNSNDL